MLVKFIQMVQQGEIRTDREVMELYWSMWTEKDSCIQKNCRRAIRRQRITGWN